MLLFVKHSHRYKSKNLVEIFLNARQNIKNVLRAKIKIWQEYDFSFKKFFFTLHIFIHFIHFYYTSAQALEIVYETTLIEARIFRFFYPILIYDQYILQIRYFFESYVKDFRFYWRHIAYYSWLSKEIVFLFQKFYIFEEVRSNPFW